MKYLNSKYKFLILTVIAFTVFVSCDDLVDEDPISQVAGENFWRNNTDATLGVIGIYDAMQKTYRLKNFIWGELRSDSYSRGSESASGNSLELIQNQLSAGNSPATRWDQLYSLINGANIAIKRIPLIDQFDEELLGEAHALRAYAYFDAVRVWGVAPLFEEPVEGLERELQLPQTDGTTILNEIVIPDMLKAEELIKRETSDYRFSQNSVWAFQASVYMWLKDYTNAKIALEKIVDSGEYSLVETTDEWQNLFLNDPALGGKIQSGPELIMSINYDINDTDRSGIYDTFFAGLPSYYLSPTLERKWIEKFPIDSAGWVDKYPGVNPQLTFQEEINDSTIVTKFNYGDWRFYFSREGGVDGNFEEFGTERVAKFNKQNYNSSQDDSDIVLYRYSGVLLMLAEAENRLEDETRALELVNEIRKARKLPLVTSMEFGSTVEERENYILDERQLELLGEGKRWWDLRRTDKVLETLNPILDTVEGANLHTEQTLLFPVFNEHLIENPLLNQTPGY